MAAQPRPCHAQLSIRQPHRASLSPVPPHSVGPLCLPSLALGSRELLRGHLQHRFDRASSDHLDHRQQKLSVLHKELYYPTVFSPFYSRLLSVTFSHGGSPLLNEVCNPILSESGR